MLLRSACTSVNSWTPHEESSSPQPETAHPMARTSSTSLTSFSSSSLLPVEDFASKRITPARSESNLLDISVPKGKPVLELLNGLPLKEEREELGFDGVIEGFEIQVGDASFWNVLAGGEVGGGGGGRICSGGGSAGGGLDGGDGGEGFEDWDANRRKASMDMHYKRMIQADPGNALILSNYARFLKEVRKDLEKAKKYYERAIRANPKDGSVLSMYADLIWQSHKDKERAESYFDQAIKAAPDDCYVMASYAHFLWDADEDDDEEVEDDIVTASPRR